MNAARNRLTRIVDANQQSLTDAKMLDALAFAIATVLDAPDISIATGLTDTDGALVAANLEGEFAGPGAFVGAPTRAYGADESTVVHISFAVGGGLEGHLVVSGLHRDWLRLVDEADLTELCIQSSHGFRLVDRVTAQSSGTDSP